MALSDRDAYRFDHTFSLVFGSTTLGKADIIAMAFVAILAQGVLARTLLSAQFFSQPWGSK
jgi:hypothetical protein